MLNGLSSLSFSYWFSLLFVSYGSAQVWIFLLYMLSGTVLANLVLFAKSFEDTKFAGTVLNYVLKCFPPYLFGSSLLDIAVGPSLYTKSFDFKSSEGKGKPWDVESFEGNGINIVYYLATTVFWLMLLIIMEQYSKTVNP